MREELSGPEGRGGEGGRFVDFLRGFFGGVVLWEMGLGGWYVVQRERKWGEGWGGGGDGKRVV